QTAKGEGLEQNHQAARPLLERGCKDGKSQIACGWLSALLAEGLGGKADPKRAQQLASDACAAKDARGCFVLGRLTEFGEGTEPSPHGGAKLYDKACTLGDADGCAAALALAVAGI